MSHESRGVNRRALRSLGSPLFERMKSRWSEKMNDIYLTAPVKLKLATQVRSPKHNRRAVRRRTNARERERERGGGGGQGGGWKKKCGGVSDLSKAITEETAPVKVGLP